VNYTIDTTELDRLRRSFVVFSDRRFRAGLAQALTATAQAVRVDQQREIRDVFDRPTQFTLGQVYVRRATADSLQAEVGISDAPYSIGYLKWHVRGGQRTRKRFEKLLISGGAMPGDRYAVPGRFARLDAFGNISTGQLRQILSQLRIESTRGATSVLPRVSAADARLVANARRGSGFVGPISGSDVKDARSRLNRVNAAYRRAGGQFVAFPNGRGKLLPGIYQVRATAFGRSDPKPVIIFVKRARYEAERFDFEYVSQISVPRNLPGQINAAMADQLRRWRAKYQGA
jgi:hypothetical protein